MFSLQGQKALVAGVANDRSVAWGCAQALRAQGADIAMTWMNAKAEDFARPLAERIGADIATALDVTQDAQMDEAFAMIAARWGRLDTLVHSIAFAPRPDLHGRVVDCAAEGFAKAMDISVHSFLRMIRRAEPLMAAGGTCLTVSFLGASRVVANYNVMGPVKAALESAVRYAASELAAKDIRVHALSPGPIGTRAASGIAGFDALLSDAVERAPTGRGVTIADVGALAAFLASPEARNMTGGVHLVDGGFSIIA